MDLWFAVELWGRSRVACAPMNRDYYKAFAPGTISDLLRRHLSRGFAGNIHRDSGYLCRTDNRLYRDNKRLGPGYSRTLL